MAAPSASVPASAPAGAPPAAGRAPRERVLCRGVSRWSRRAAVYDALEDEPYTHLRFALWKGRAWLEPDADGTRWSVRRRGLATPTFELLRDGRRHARARRSMGPIGRCYRVEWPDGPDLRLVGTGARHAWVVLADDRPEGEVRPSPLFPRALEVELPGGTPDEILLFVACVATMHRYHPPARAAEWARLGWRP